MTEPDTDQILKSSPNNEIITEIENENQNSGSESVEFSHVSGTPNSKLPPQQIHQSI